MGPICSMWLPKATPAFSYVPLSKKILLIRGVRRASVAHKLQNAGTSIRRTWRASRYAFCSRTAAERASACFFCFYSLEEKHSTGTKVHPRVKGESAPEPTRACSIVLQKRLARPTGTWMR